MCGSLESDFVIYCCCAVYFKGVSGDDGFMSTLLALEERSESRNALCKDKKAKPEQEHEDSDQGWWKQGFNCSQ